MRCFLGTVQISFALTIYSAAFLSIHTSYLPESATLRVCKMESSPPLLPLSVISSVCICWYSVKFTHFNWGRTTVSPGGKKKGRVIARFCLITNFQSKDSVEESFPTEGRCFLFSLSLPMDSLFLFSVLQSVTVIPFDAQIVYISPGEPLQAGSLAFEHLLAVLQSVVSSLGRSPEVGLWGTASSLG